MFELVQTGEKSFYIDCPAKIGVYRINDADVYLIDSGNDKDAGRKVLKILREKGWSLKGIINTHSHADHIGGNQYLQRQTRCRIFANRIETAFTKYPILEGSLLYGGYPCKSLRHKFLLAAESEAVDITADCFPGELEVIPLPGHSFDMIGLRTPDNTVFLADCITGKEILEKYQVAFICNVEDYLETLDVVERLEAEIFVPAHAEATPDVGALVDVNRRKVHEIEDKLVSLCREPRTFESILQEIFSAFSLTMNIEQHVLVGSTIRSYLSWLNDAGRIQPCFDDNRLLWRCTE